MTSTAKVGELAAAPWLIEPAAQAVLGAIAAGGFEARVVGGAVRNTLMGLPVTDIDMATTALPDDVIRLAQAAGLATAPTGLAHGTVTVIVAHRGFEVTTLRKDVETHGRHATVAFTDDWEADARRRDFTINALYCSADGTVHDPLGGRQDVLARRVRFIGDAGERIREDYLRILRFFRFGAQYGDGTPDGEGLAACVREREGLAHLSGERIRQEMMRLLMAPGALHALEALREFGILPEVLPAVPRPMLLARLVGIDRANGLAADAALRLAALAVETAEDVERLVARLRLSGEEREVLLLAVGPSSRLARAPSPALARELLYREGRERYRRLIALSLARCLAVPVTDADWLDALSLPGRWSAPVFPVKGADLVARGLRPGPRIGATLRALEDWWIAEGFAPDRAALLARLAVLPVSGP